MGVKYNIDFRTLNDIEGAVLSGTEKTAGGFDRLKNALEDMANTPYFKGATAESIKNIIDEVYIKLIIPVLSIAINELVMKTSIYCSGYWENIDSCSSARLNEEAIEEAVQNTGTRRQYFMDAHNEIIDIINSVSDITEVSYPNIDIVYDGLYDIREKMDKLDEDINEYENYHLAQMQSLHDMLQEINTMMKSLLDMDEAQIKSYKPGQYSQLYDLTGLGNMINSSLQYQADNQEKFEKAYRIYMDAAKEIAIARREEKGKIEILQAVINGGAAVFGVIATVCSGGALGPVFVVSLIETGFYASDFAEGCDDIRLAKEGDIYTTAYNPVRDTVFAGNPETYETARTVSGYVSMFTGNYSIIKGNNPLVSTKNLIAGAVFDTSCDIFVSNAVNTGAEKTIDFLSSTMGLNISEIQKVEIMGLFQLGGESINAGRKYKKYVDNSKIKSAAAGEMTNHGQIAQINNAVGAEVSEHISPEVSGHVKEKQYKTELEKLTAESDGDGNVIKVMNDAGEVVGIGGESGYISVQHAVGSSNQVQSVLNGIDPKYFNPKSRFGEGFYVGADSNTIVLELAEHGNLAKYAISYDMNLSGQNVLDLTDPIIASKWNYVQNLTSTESCQEIGILARKQGYNVIKFQSYRGNGINYVIYNNFDDILIPRSVSPVD